MFTPKQDTSRLFFYFTLLFLLCSCTKQVQDIPTGNVDAVWKNYLSSSLVPMTPFRTEVSLRFGTDGNTNRVNALLWGNSSNKLRLDIMTSIGTSVAKIYEDNREFILFIPQEEKVYIHKGSQKPLFNLGIPLPLRLTHLTYILQGQYANVFGVERSSNALPAHSSNILKENLKDIPLDAIAYTLPDNTFQGTLILNSSGNPIYWQDNNKDGWFIFIYYKDHATMPYKLYIKHIGTKNTARLIIKKHISNLDLFTAKQIQLIYPQDTILLPLDTLQ